MSSPVRVLVVDDELIAQTVAEGLLVGAGIEVTVAGGVDEALTRLRSGPPPDVVLTDLMMPVRDGFDLLAEIRATPDLATLPVVFLTAAADRAARLRALDAGADELLAKPIDEAELLARVRSLASLTRARRRADALQELASVVDAVGEGVVVATSEGIVLRANDAAARLLDLADPVGVDLPTWLVETFELAEGDPVWGERGSALLRRTARGEGVDLWLRIDVAPLEGSGGVAVTIRDAREEVRAERWSDVILSGVGHELRTPLTGIRGATDLLEVQGADQRLVDILRRSGERLERGISRLLDFADRVASGATGERVVLDPAALDPVAELVAERHVDLVRGAAGSGPAVRVDRDALVVALGEYLDNALEHDDRAEVVVRVTTDARGATVRVEDGGPGFPSEDVDRLFEPFFQVDRSGQAGGIGLGLALTRRAVEGAGGRITAGRDAERTYFEAWLPALA